VIYIHGDRKDETVVFGDHQGFILAQVGFYTKSFWYYCYSIS